MTDATVMLELRQLRQAVAELRDEQQALVRALLTRDDRRIGGALVPLLAEVFGTDTFTAAAIQHRALNDRTDAGQALRELVGERVIDQACLRSFGRLLARLEGGTFSGVRLATAGQQHSVARWRVICA